MKLKILNALLAVMFLSFAVVQYNDPDPLLWMLVYGSMMTLCILSIFGFHPVRLMIAMIGGILILSAQHVDGFGEWLRSPNRYLLFEDLAKMQYPYIEEAREFLGLLICLAVLLFNFYKYKNSSKANQ